MKKMMKYFMLIILLAVVAVGFFAYNYLYKRNTGFDEKSKLIYIHTGANFSDVMNKLKSENIIKDVTAFEWLSKKKKIHQQSAPRLLQNYKRHDQRSHCEFIAIGYSTTCRSKV